MTISKEQHIAMYFHNNIWKPDRQYTYNITLRRFHATNVAEEKQ